jgi:starch phosphorylase
MHVVYCWLKLKETSDFDMHPRTFIFGGKAAPSYVTAKSIISLICHVAEMINRDSTTNDRIKIVFLPNYRVTLAELIIPAADVSEQISTAGFEASGTGNMKFALNGALTVGTLDGANIEIMEAVGPENIFIFGLNAADVRALRDHYNPQDYIQADPILRKAVRLIRQGFFNPEDTGRFRPLMDQLGFDDRYLVAADFAAYHQCQQNVDGTYRNRMAWFEKAICNVARMGQFSSDRTIQEYNRDIWQAKPLKITRGNADEKP